jgi:hypothetical protein
VAPPKGKNAALTIAGALCVMLAAALGLRLAGRGEAYSHRVVVAAVGCGAPCDGQLSRALASELSGLGFDAVAPSGLDGPDAVRSFARDHGARFGVTMLVSVEQSTVLDDAAQRVGANAVLYVIDARSDDPPQPSFVLRGIEEAKDERTALSFLALRLLRGLSPVIGSSLLSSEPVRALQRGASGLEQQAAALTLKKHEKNLVAREQAIREYRSHCEGNDELLSGLEGARCVSGGCAEEYLVALLPDGRAAIVHDSTDAAVFPLAPDSTARSLSTAERLWLVPRDGERKLLAEAANYYSRPDLSRDGSTLAYVEQRLGHARLYAQPLHDGPRVLVDTAAPPGHLTEPRLSADGRQLIFYAVERRGGRASLRIADVARPGSGRELLPHALDARFAELPLARGEAPRRVIAALVPAEDRMDKEHDASDPGAERDERHHAPIGVAAPYPALLLIDPESGRVLFEEHALPHHVRAIGDAVDGQLLLGFQDASCGFARYAPGQPIAWTRTDLCPKHITSGHGGVYAHAQVDGESGFRQLVRIDIENGKISVLTRGAQDVQRPKPAAASDALAYERVMPRKYGELQHVAVCFDER